MNNKILMLILVLLSSIGANAADKNSEEARRMFEKAYNQVFGPQGSSLSYSVNIIGLYKTKGDITYKGKKLRYIEDRFESYSDGITVYKADKKKKKVFIYRTDDDSRDRYMSKFKFNIDDYNYSLKSESNYYIITAHNKHSSLTNVREAQIKVVKSNLYPISLKVKVAILSATVKITKFKCGDISDDIFVFPKEKFEKYEVEDHR